LRLAKMARRERKSSVKRNRPVIIERNKSGARGMRDKMRGREVGDS
jgi:hypothetical protein